MCIIFLPATALCLFDQLVACGKVIGYLWPFVVGVVAYIILWYTIIRHADLNFLSTLEHEITHCFFAWLTFNRVIALKATLRSGGHMRYFGTPNWLIQTAPYFFPTITVFLLIASRLVDSKWGLLVYGLLGASIAYHITSTWTETHHMQTDLQEAGIFFSVLFLPTANLLCYALILAHLRLGFFGTAQVFESLLNSPVNPARLLVSG